jgi:3-methyladenine DNA glycosylase AlkD
MNRWAADFDNWAICDTACFHLFDRTPYAWEKVETWSRSPREFVRRAAFALIAGLAVHDKVTPDGRFRALLPLIERSACDNRHYVKKGVNWALRQVGKRSPMLNAAALSVAKRLVRSKDPSARWVGNDALVEFSDPRTRVGGRRGLSCQL